jgi:hypothetical protein
LRKHYCSRAALWQKRESSIFIFPYTYICCCYTRYRVVPKNIHTPYLKRCGILLNSIVYLFVSRSQYFFCLLTQYNIRKRSCFYGSHFVLLPDNDVTTMLCFWGEAARPSPLSTMSWGCNSLFMTIVLFLLDASSCARWTKMYRVWRKRGKFRARFFFACLVVLLVGRGELRKQK